MDGELIRLNVGGTLYITSRSTLCKEESFLSALVSGRHSDAIVDGAYFIDRDGPLFRHVLNFLRRGRLIVALDDATLLEELLDEAKFYQLASLVTMLEPSKHSFVYSESAKDTGGLFYWLGTSRGTTPWSNPVTTRAVRVRSSKSMSGPAEAICARVPSACGICTDSRGQWVEIDISKGCLLHCTHYSIRHGKCCIIANWTFQGSEDREKWHTLLVHADDSSIVGNGSPHVFEIPRGTERRFFRWFRLLGTGRDQSSPTCYCMHFSCLELWGELRLSKVKKVKIHKSERSETGGKN